MYSIGDKFQVPGLCEHAVRKYEEILKSNWGPEEFLESVAKIYDSTPESNRSFRNLAVNHARQNVRLFQATDDMRALLRSTTLEVPEFTSDLLQSYIDTPIRGICPYCGPGRSTEPIQLRCLDCGKAGARMESY